jgi:hypothetical protein
MSRSTKDWILLLVAEPKLGLNEFRRGRCDNKDSSAICISVFEINPKILFIKLKRSCLGSRGSFARCCTIIKMLHSRIVNVARSLKQHLNTFLQNNGDVRTAPLEFGCSKLFLDRYRSQRQAKFIDAPGQSHFTLRFREVVPNITY